MSQQQQNEIVSNEMEAIAPTDPPPEPGLESAQYSSSSVIDDKNEGWNINRVVVSLCNSLVGMMEKTVITDRLIKLFSDTDDCTKRTRAYQVWQGNNVFLFGGRFICGPDPKGLLFTVVSISISSWIFGVYVANDFPNHSTLITMFSAVLTCIVLVNLILVSMIDPGIIPRNEQPSIEEVVTGDRIRKKRIHVNGIEVKLKYCPICKIHRPPRCCHCAICNNCVERFDHHCPWIGQCIGLRNYRLHLTFLAVGFVFFFYIFSYCFWRIHERVFKGGMGFSGLLRSYPETVALALFSFGAIWFLGALASYHVYLIAKNQTFYENFRQRFVDSENPYDKGIMGNFKEILFSPWPPCRVDFRAEVTPKRSGSCNSNVG